MPQDLQVLLESDMTPSQIVDALSENFWSGTHELSKRANELQSKHVPGSGPAKHLEGELQRASSKIHYDYYNNGFGNDWSGAHKLLTNHADKLESHHPGVRDALDRLDAYKHGDNYVGNSPAHANAVDTLVTATTKMLDHADKQGKFGPHPGDMLSHK